MVAPRISLVIPVYNEEENLPELFRELTEVLEKLSVSFEIIFIDDGSRDRSGAILRGFALQDKRVRIIFFQKNCGQSAAFAAGFRSAPPLATFTRAGRIRRPFRKYAFRKTSTKFLMIGALPYAIVVSFAVHRTPAVQ